MVEFSDVKRVAMVAGGYAVGLGWVRPRHQPLGPLGKVVQIRGIARTWHIWMFWEVSARVFLPNSMFLDFHNSQETSSHC